MAYYWSKKRSIVNRLLGVTSLLRKLSVPFRGHRDDAQSMNKGVFKEFVLFFPNTDSLLKEHIVCSISTSSY